MKTKRNRKQGRKKKGKRRRTKSRMKRKRTQRKEERLNVMREQSAAHKPWRCVSSYAQKDMQLGRKESR